MNRTEWLSTSEIAEIMGRSEWVIRTRCRVRNRDDSIPSHLLDRSGRSFRIHESYARPTAPPPGSPRPTPLRSFDQIRIDRLVESNKALRAQIAELSAAKVQLEMELADTREALELAS